MNDLTTKIFNNATCPYVLHSVSDVVTRNKDGSYRCSCGCKFTRTGEFEWKILRPRENITFSNLEKVAPLQGDKMVEIVELGSGDTAIYITRELDEDFDSGICMTKTEEFHEIGEYSQEFAGKTTDQFNTVARIHFSNPKSVQVLIEQLQVLKTSMDEREASHPLTI